MQTGLRGRDLISLQEWNDDAVHASSQQVKLGRDAKFKHIVVSLGGDLVRVTPSARFTGPGAGAEVTAAGVLNDIVAITMQERRRERRRK